jgi:predicted nuclease of predicted toxin-antitoxin system
LKLLLDHNLSPRLAKALDTLFVAHEIIALRDKFLADVTDVDWITALDREGGWAVAHEGHPNQATPS